MIFNFRLYAKVMGGIGVSELSQEEDERLANVAIKKVYGWVFSFKRNTQSEIH